VIPATQIKVGMVILFDGKPCRVTERAPRDPGELAWDGSRQDDQTLVTGSQVENRFRSEDKVVRADLDHHPFAIPLTAPATNSRS